jgi:hypothetical protein
MIEPLIISASRATDIPAFYTPWFINALERGYCQTTNPYNGITSLISFKKTRLIVFWTKNPAPLLPLLHELDERGIGYYVLFSVNDYEADGLEPHIPQLSQRIDTFVSLSRAIGKEKVIWRYDPLLLTRSLEVETLCARVRSIGDALCSFTDKLVFSFVDIEKYRCVKRSTSANDVGIREFSLDEKLRCASVLQSLVTKWHEQNPSFVAASCAQDIELASFDIHHNSCIDPLLILKIFKHDAILTDFIRGLSPSSAKDKGQRPLCRCLWSKDIGRYNTCLHGCVYCYAIASPWLTRFNHSHHVSTDVHI